MPVFWYTNPPKISALACFRLSHFILLKDRSLPDPLDFILSASVWVILLKSSSSLRSSSVTLLDIPLQPKLFLLWRQHNGKILVMKP